MNRIIEDVRRQRILSIDGQMRPYLVAQRIFVIVAQTTHLGVDFIYFFHFGFIRFHSIVYFGFFFWLLRRMHASDGQHTLKIRTRKKTTTTLFLSTPSRRCFSFLSRSCAYTYSNAISLAIILVHFYDLALHMYAIRSTCSVCVCVTRNDRPLSHTCALPMFLSIQRM